MIETASIVFWKNHGPRESFDLDIATVVEGRPAPGLAATTTRSVAAASSTRKRRCWSCGPVVGRRCRLLRRQIDAEGAAARHGVFKNGMIVAPPDPKMRGSSAALPRREWFYEKGIGFYLPEILVGDPARFPAPPCPTRSRSQQVPEASYSMVKSNSGNMYFCWLCVKVDSNSFF